MHQVTGLTSKSSSEPTPVSWPVRYWQSATVILFFKTEQHLSHFSYPSYVPVSLQYLDIKPQSVSGGAAAALGRMMPLIQAEPLAGVRQQITTISNRRMLKWCPCFPEIKSEKPYCHAKEIPQKISKKDHLKYNIYALLREMDITNLKNLMSKLSPFSLFSVIQAHLMIRPLCHIGQLLIKYSLNDSEAKCCNTDDLELYNQFNRSMIKRWAPFSPYGIQYSSELNTKEQRLFFLLST